MADNTKPKGQNSLSPHRLMLLVTIVQKGKGTFFSEYLKNFEANLQVCVVGVGTAEKDLAEFLGLNDNPRSVIFSVVREDKLNAIFEALAEQFAAVNDNMGLPLRCR